MLKFMVYFQYKERRFKNNLLLYLFYFVFFRNFHNLFPYIDFFTALLAVLIVALSSFHSCSTVRAVYDSHFQSLPFILCCIPCQRTCLFQIVPRCSIFFLLCLFRAYLSQNEAQSFLRF